MERRRITISTLAIVVAIVAVDCAWLRFTIHHGRSLCGLDAPAFDVGILTIGSLLALGLSQILSSRGRIDPFLIGFEVGGFVMVVVHVVCCREFPNTVRFYLNPLYVFWRMWRPGWPSVAYLYFADAVLFAIPQLLVALAGGMLARWIAKRRGDSPGRDP